MPARTPKQPADTPEEPDPETGTPDPQPSDPDQPKHREERPTVADVITQIERAIVTQPADMLPAYLTGLIAGIRTTQTDEHPDDEHEATP